MSKYLDLEDRCPLCGQTIPETTYRTRNSGQVSGRKESYNVPEVETVYVMTTHGIQAISLTPRTCKIPTTEINPFYFESRPVKDPFVIEPKPSEYTKFQIKNYLEEDKSLRFINYDKERIREEERLREKEKARLLAEEAERRQESRKRELKENYSFRPDPLKEPEFGLGIIDFLRDPVEEEKRRLRRLYSIDECQLLKPKESTRQILSEDYKFLEEPKETYDFLDLKKDSLDSDPLGLVRQAEKKLGVDRQTSQDINSFTQFLSQTELDSLQRIIDQRKWDEFKRRMEQKFGIVIK